MGRKCGGQVDGDSAREWEIGYNPAGDEQIGAVCLQAGWSTVHNPSTKPVAGCCRTTLRRKLRRETLAWEASRLMSATLGRAIASNRRVLRQTRRSMIRHSAETFLLQSFRALQE